VIRTGQDVHDPEPDVLEETRIAQLRTAGGSTDFLLTLSEQLLDELSVTCEGTNSKKAEERSLMSAPLEQVNVISKRRNCEVAASARPGLALQRPVPLRTDRCCCIYSSTRESGG